MKYIIIGGDAAGMSAATQIRRQKPDAEIIVYEKGEVLSYAQCGLPYYVAGLVPSVDDLKARTKEQFEEKYKIKIFTKHEVTKIDSKNNKVEVKRLDNTNSLFEDSYDNLLIATGGEAIVPNWDGVSLEGVMVIKNIPDADKIINYLDKNPDIKDIVIVGGGYIGLEMAEAFHIRNKNVHIIHHSEQVQSSFDPEMAEHAIIELESKGIKVSLRENTLKIKGKEMVSSIVTDKGEYPADLVLISIGIKPNSDFAKEAGIELGPKNSILVNSKMQTNIENIYAAGDCASHYHRIKKKDDYIPLGTTANKQGRIAGTNLGGGSKDFEGIIGSAVLKVLDLDMARTGLSEKEAKSLNLDYETVTIKSKHHATYYPDAKKMHIKLLFNKSDRTLLGGQVVGYAGVDKRIDVLAMAITQGMKVDDLQDIDLSYAPPFNSVWDPLQQASRVAEKK